MNNLDLNILERAHARPDLSRWGLIDSIGRSRQTERRVDRLIANGYLSTDSGGIELSKKGLASIDSSSLRNRSVTVGKGALAIAASVVAVVIGNWLWSMLQPHL